MSKRIIAASQQVGDELTQDFWFDECDAAEDRPDVGG